ncbi:hypothetical protein VNO78_03371 [Psophocarpus tetragonolobus]|uniref:Uncharacterized protein n=1 Tax=Psophocarpus tetragonolobus TaxID=3891 RepID=A0AAN9T0B1_PSOTE
MTHNAKLFGVLILSNMIGVGLDEGVADLGNHDWVILIHLGDAYGFFDEGANERGILIIEVEVVFLDLDLTAISKVSYCEGKGIMGGQKC